MKKTGLQEDQEIFVEIKGSQAGVYATKVLDIEGGNFKMAAPQIQGVTIPLNRGDKVSISYTTPRGKFIFMSRVQERFRDPLPHYILQRPDKIYRVQRREYVRVEVEGRIYYRLRPIDGEEGSDFSTGRIIDLSGGGVGIKGPLKITEGNELEMEIPLLPIAFPLLGVVRRLREDKKGEAHKMGVAFVDMESNLREKIISWLFEYQRSLQGAGDG